MADESMMDEWWMDGGINVQSNKILGHKEEIWDSTEFSFVAGC